MTSIKAIGFLLSIYGAVSYQLIPDCDMEFSSQAIKLIRSKIDDPVKMDQIEAILASCMKSRMQKLTEISVFLLEKGVFPSRVVEEIRRLEQMLRSERYKRLEHIRKNLPSNLGKTMDEVTSVLMSNSLSGNEKLLSLSNAIAALPRDYRKLMERFLNQEATATRANPGTPYSKGVRTFHGEPTKSVYDLSRNETDRDPKSYPIIRDLDRLVEEHKKISSSAVTRKSDIPPLDSPSAPGLFRKPPIIESHSETQSIGLISKNHRKPSVSQYHVGSINAPMDPIVPTNVRSQIIEKTTAPNTDLLDDADLLNPRMSLVSDAVRLLESAIPRIKTEMPRYITPISQRYTSPYTFPLLEQVYERPSPASNIATSHLEYQSLLPYRHDGSSSARVDVSSTNSEKELARFDTNIGRFANGVATRVVLPSSLPTVMNEITTINGLNSGFSQQKSIMAQNSSYKTYRNYRERLLPEAVNQANYEQRQAEITQVLPSQHWSQRWNDKAGNQEGTLLNSIPSTTNPRTLFIKNVPSSQYDVAARPNLTTDLQERITQSVIYSQSSSFPDPVRTPLPEFRPYRSPETITGSHVAREVYNVRHLGQPRYVKIDLLNE